MCPSNANAAVSFNNNNVDIEEAAPAVDGQELSQSEKAWDIDGDGKLSATEKALKDIDATGKGTLSKGQMHSLMRQNLGLQRDLSKIKKIVIALAAVTVLLALANVGVAFAAAYLAKDSKVEGGVLVAVRTGEAIQTDSAATVYRVEPLSADSSRRHLQGCSNLALPTNQCVSQCSRMGLGNCAKLMSGCMSGNAASVDDGKQVRPICPFSAGTVVTYEKDDGGEFTSLSASDEVGTRTSGIQIIHGSCQIYTLVACDVQE